MTTDRSPSSPDTDANSPPPFSAGGVKRLTCVCGNTWDHFGADPLPADLRQICPVCSGAGDSTLDVRMSPVTPRAAEPIAEPTVGPGQVLEGFEILEEINRGGMGVIYKAKQRALNRVVALKLISQHRLTQPGVRERFQREVQAAALLSHPNIVTVFHTDLEGRQPYLAMEYVAGIDLQSLVAKVGPLPVSEACGYILQAAEGLQHVFEQGLVHRDIKPANVMVTPSPLTKDSRSGRSPRVKILDLGLARATTVVLQGDGALTEAGQFLGTPHYISPEQAENCSKVDIRSDLYSLGATLYYLLTGEVPFPTTNLLHKLRRQLTEPAPSPRVLRADIPPAVDQVVRCLLARDPAERYETPDAFIVALQKALSEPQLVSEARQPSPQDSVPSLAAAPSKGDVLGTLEMLADDPDSLKATIQVGAHAGGVHSLCLSVDGHLLLSGGADSALRLWNAQLLRQKLCISEDVGIVQQVAMTPRARWAACCSLRQAKKMLIQLWDLTNGQELRRLTGLTDQPRCVAVSPDGRRVAAGTDKGTVRVWAVDNPGTGALELTGHTAQVTCVSFLPGDRLLSASRDGTVRLWDMKTAPVKNVLLGGQGAIVAVAAAGRRLAIADDAPRIRQANNASTILRAPSRILSLAFSQDGARLATGGIDGTVRVWNASDGKELARMQCHEGDVRGICFSPSGDTVYSGGADGTLHRWPIA